MYDQQEEDFYDNSVCCEERTLQLGQYANIRGNMVTVVVQQFMALGSRIRSNEYN